MLTNGSIVKNLRFSVGNAAAAEIAQVIDVVLYNLIRGNLEMPPGSEKLAAKLLIHAKDVPVAPVEEVVKPITNHSVGELGLNPEVFPMDTDES